MTKEDGTSPRLWGDCSEQEFPANIVRYIPTPVGRFSVWLIIIAHAAVHPHACGEIGHFDSTFAIPPVLPTPVHPVGRLEASPTTGTSPRLWGDWKPCLLHPAHYRYIPTPVGRFRQRPMFLSSKSVHPHACGEIFPSCQPSPHVGGTSPRLWGDLLKIATH